jgi:hypothetical protein
VPYAEVEPISGGQRAAVLLTSLERDFRLESDVVAAEQIAADMINSGR